MSARRTSNSDPRSGWPPSSAESETLNFCASCPIVSPDLTVYMKGVGEGKGVVTETTNPSGCEAVAVGSRREIWLNILEQEFAPDLFVLQAVANKIHRIINLSHEMIIIENELQLRRISYWRQHGISSSRTRRRSR